ncbi:MAG: TRAP transporter small permease [Agathobaculum sp.]|jgi:TRAP-type C4-dicarboxylate transport system permease small subunit|uniref:TRAP transporter small permease n=1 Tax=Agathobaculum sp. TaxID=2048138 RepID=UPI003D8D5A9B
MAKQQFDLTQTLFWKILHQTIKWLMIIGSVVSTACMVYAVIVRYIFTGNFYGSDEVIMLFAFWLYFMGAAYGSFENSHIKADLLNVYIKNMRVKDGIAVFAQFCTVVVNTVILVWATRYFTSEIAKWGLSTSLKIPLVIPKSAIFFGFLLMEFYHVYYLQRDLRTYFKKGIFSEPRPGDYISAKVKAKYPELDIPTKEERAAQAKDASEKGGRE